jgi:hypothetical protein
LTGFFFGVARDVLGELIKATIGKKFKRIVEHEVRVALIEHYTRMQPQAAPDSLNVETMNILVQEVYAIAGASHGLLVQEGAIQVQASRKLQIPQFIREMQIARRVQRMKSEIEEVANQEICLDALPVQDLGSLQVQTQQPFMFPEINPTDEDSNPRSEQIPGSDILDQYRSRIQRIIEEEKDGDGDKR